VTAVSDPPLDAELTALIENGISPSATSLLGTSPVARAHRRGWLVRRVLLIADILGLAGAFLLAELAVPVSGGRNTVGNEEEWLLFLLVLPLWVVAARAYGLYSHDEERTDHRTIDDFGGVFHLVTIGTCTTFFVGSLSGMVEPDPIRMAVFWLAAVSFMTLGRIIGRIACRKSTLYVQKTLVVGSGGTAELVAQKVQRHPEYGLELVGLVDDAIDEEPENNGLANLPRFSSLATAPLLARALGIERLIIAIPNAKRERVIHLIRGLRELDIQIDIVPFFFDVLSPSMDIHSIEGLPLLGLRPARLPRSSILFKRAMDLTLSALGLLVLAPLFCLIAIAIKLDSRGPIFFRQVRMGSKDKTFRIFKFRTMEVDADARRAELRHLSQHAGKGRDAFMLKIPDDPRVTRVGHFLRRYSLDELPQLFNVLIGEMSLVGPRPLPLDEDSFVTEWARHRLDLKPGITGPWQVLGRHEIPFEEMVELDYRYVTNWSLGRDLKLTLQTIPVLVRGSAV
jgi:exopolysaccharide biosynthesis polyprenyl glycosylphosphotransferase